MGFKKKIIFVHLLNDYSGSPLVLSMIVKHFASLESSYEVALYTAYSKQAGFLSNITGLHYRFIFYRWSTNKLLTLFYFFLAQVQLFFKILLEERNSMVYINSVLPFGAALAAKIRRLPIVYHVHETSVSPPSLKKLLFFVANNCANQAIYVSQFLKTQEPLPKVSKKHFIYNALSPEFEAKANKAAIYNFSDPFNVLMLCSLKRYKGVDKFIELAHKLPDIQFTLVLNSDQKSIETYFVKAALPANVTLFSSTNEVDAFYQKAAMVLNLSLPDQWVETFGLTLLEALRYGRPIVAPNVGGPTEILSLNPKAGASISAYQLEAIAQFIQMLHRNPLLYQKAAEEAKKLATQFAYQNFISKIEEVVNC